MILGDTPSVSANSTFADVSTYTNFNNTFSNINKLGTSNIVITHSGFINLFILYSIIIYVLMI